MGFLYPGPHPAASPRLAAFMSGLQAGGLHAADRFTLTPRVTGGDASLLVPMAAELVALKVDLIAAIGPAAVRAARTATPSIPIVANDGIRRWRAASLPASSRARPQCNRRVPGSS